MARNNILRWVGSKTHAIDLLNGIISFDFDNLIELYCGSAIISIELNKRLNIKRTFCVDIDKNIINFYNDLKRIPTEFIKHYKINWNLLKTDYLHYYKVRERFNTNNNSLDWFFLNRTCINGLMRYNHGKMNTSLHPNRNGTKPETIEKIILKNLNSLNKIEFLNKDCLNFINSFNRFLLDLKVQNLFHK